MTVREVLAAAIPPDAWAWAAIIVGAWLLLAATGTAGYSLFAGKLKRLRSSRVRRPQYPPVVPPVVVHWIKALPPVPLPTTPPFTQTVPSADWFYDVPADCLSDDAIRVLADDIAANFRVIGGAA